jgi:hypothetical protein
MLCSVAQCGVAPGNVVLCSVAVRSAVLCSVAPCDSMPVGVLVLLVPLVVLLPPVAVAVSLLPLAPARVRRGATAAAFALFGCQGGSPRHKRPP